MTDSSGKHVRRPRYRGTHPRKFHEKYKELNPEKYAADVEKILASGKTPAGTHRPICVAEILQILDPKPGEIAVDATLGYGGHAREILNRILPGGRLIGLDTDPLELPKTEARLRALGFAEDALTVQRSNFAGLARVLGTLGVPGANVLLADLGCSSMQLDNPSRGFSYKLEGPLDLRLNPTKGSSAAAWLATASISDLEQVLTENADEPDASLLATGLVAWRQERPIETTTGLTNAIRHILRENRPRLADEAVKSTLQRVFQALRIAVNDEFGALDTFLRFLPDCIAPGGRVAILTFHSGEDRRVKKAFQEGERSGVYEQVARDVIRPTAAEVQANPRAASAKLRWAIKASATPA